MKLLDLESLSSASLLVFANKMDVKGAMSSAEICENLKLPEILKNRSWNVRSSCALTGEGLTEGLDWLVNDLNKS